MYLKIKLIYLSFGLLLLTGCVLIKDKSTQNIASLYPSENKLVRYHTEWAKTNYKVRIQQFRKEPLNYGDIVFLGNSITQQGKDWNVKLGVPNVRNRGIAGDVTDGVLMRLKEITHFKPTAVFLLIGINDLGNLHQKKEIPSAEYVAKNILKIAKTIHKGSRKTKIYIQTILPTSREYLKENIQKVNDIIEQNDTEGLYTVIDLHSQFINDEGLLRKDLTNDGTHLTEKGYDVWVKFIRPMVVQGRNNVQLVYPGGNMKRTSILEKSSF